ncbi:MAG: hypothetical protein CMQ88_03495 [Gammaproteobacteria bacterium]|nr:hypothetical protein [Gammaproteobacteria bacterium]
MDKKLQQIRKRLFNDFPFYAKSALKIRTKDGDIAPLDLNPAQQILQDAVSKQIASEGKVRVIILKARQQGLSTYTGGYLYYAVSQQPARKAMVVTHHSDSTRALFDMTKRFHENCPEILKPHTKYSSRRELSFDVLDSSFVVATAGGDSVGRGETLTHVHASELAFWNKSTAQDIWNGLIQAVPNTKGTAIFVESTANGVTGVFYDLWKGAVEGTNGFIPVFIPWFTDPDYREPVPAKFERTPDEEDLAEEYNLDDEQLMFRRRKIAQNGIDLFNQEYPAHPSHAFLNTGRPVFNPEQLTKCLDDAKDVKERLALEADEFVFNRRGELTTYINHDPGEQYVVGADVAMGVRNGDYSVAQILDSKKRQVATWRGQVHPDYFAEVLYALGTYYNEAFICVENNSHGILTCTRLGKDMAYPNFYTEVQHDKITDRETVKLGFSTTAKTKPLIIDQLRAAMREGEIELNDKTTIREMLTYIVTESGAMEAEASCFDDCVISMALANYVHEGAWEPVDVPEELYLEMV